jgi:hypothetical protein
VTDVPPVPWPGVEPQPFDFPYAEAATARQALDELLVELQDVGTAHHQAYADISDANQGDTVTYFRLGHSARMEALGMGQVLVMAALTSLDAMVAAAHAEEDQRAADRQAWAGRRARYDEARAAGLPVGPRPGSRRPMPV